MGAVATAVTNAVPGAVRGTMDARHLVPRELVGRVGSLLHGFQGQEVEIRQIRDLHQVVDLHANLGPAVSRHHADREAAGLGLL
jgi:hypothetical protein